MSKLSTGPWPDLATARFFLRRLSDNGKKPQPAFQAGKGVVDFAALAAWFIKQGLGPLVYNRFRHSTQATDQALLALLQADAFSAVAENSLHFDALSAVLARLAKVPIPVALLKGAALAGTVYGRPDLRTMSDVDLWLRAEDMAQATAAIQALGFQVASKATRPLALQILSKGEIQLLHPQWPNSLIELHWSPFPGWWLSRTAAVDDVAIWKRMEPIHLIDGGQTGDNENDLVWQLAAEDALIHVAVHLAVNSQFGLHTTRGLMDVTLTAQRRAVDWLIVVKRARQWRVATAVWLVLHLADTLIVLPGAGAALEQLRPSALRRLVLSYFVSPESVLAGRDLRHGRSRYLLLLLLVDRLRDAVKLLFRTVWPERQWLLARYGVQAGRLHHLWNVVRRGQI